MLRMRSLFMGNHAICVAQRPCGALTHTRRVLTGALLTFLLGFVGASAALAQEQEQPERQQRQERPEQQERQDRQERVTDWATDNLDMVSASPEQIREVLTKDPGLMVELKRLMAKQAIEKGQIVAEQDLEDTVILDRLATDTRFRALATRLKAYGELARRRPPGTAGGPRPGREPEPGAGRGLPACSVTRLR